MKKLLQISLIMMFIVFTSGCSNKIHTPVVNKSQQLETMQEKQDWVYNNINNSTYWNPSRFKAHLGQSKRYNIPHGIDGRIIIRALYYKEANITIMYNYRIKKTSWVYGEANSYDDQ